MTTDARREAARAALELMRVKVDEARRARDAAARELSDSSRWNPAQLEALRDLAPAVVREIERDFQALLRLGKRVGLVDVREVNSETAFDDLAAPFAMLRFTVDGQPGWLRWDPASAVAMVEAALGQVETRGPLVRKLSPIERGVFLRLCSVVIDPFARALGIAAQEVRSVDQLEQVGNWRDGGSRADPRRMCVELAFDHAGGGLCLHLPQIAARDSQPPRAAQVGGTSSLSLELPPGKAFSLPNLAVGEEVVLRGRVVATEGGCRARFESLERPIPPQSPKAFAEDGA
jgi:hypothetical protein